MHCSFLTLHTIYLVDPSFGASLLHVGPDFKITQEKHTVVPGQGAICWAQSDLALNTLYAIDAGKNKIWTLDSKSGALTGSIPLHNSTDGLFDSAIHKGKMYSLSGADGITVVDLAQRREVQFLNLTTFEPRQGYQGMATWSAS